jgi:HD-GYP domain-containing protein (c-di-GMP phosphodiesterase class II)
MANPTPRGSDTSTREDAERAQQSPLGGVASTLRAEGRLSNCSIAQPHPLIVTIRKDDNLVLFAPAAAWDRGRDLFKPFASHFGEAKAALVLIGTPTRRGLDDALHRGLSAVVTDGGDSDRLYVAVHNAFELLEARQRSEMRGQWVNRYRTEVGEFVEIARAITEEREIDKLLALILSKSRQITCADAGSIYVVEGDDPEMARRVLHFKLAQNDSVVFDASEFTVPITPQSISGYVALNRCTLNIADVYQLPADAPYGFDRSFDDKLGYRTKSILCTPLLSRRGDAIGVLQLINKKRDAQAKLLNPEEDAAQIVPFDDRSEGVLSTVAPLAGISLENAILYAENERMLEGFVRASVEAIEQRDPTTSGHSIRVADVTVALAQAVERTETGVYREVTWRGDDIKELEYASLLHDFGKIGVREEVLVKAKKLYPHELSMVQQRFALAKRSAEVEMLRRKIDSIKRGASEADVEALDLELAERMSEIDAAYALVLEANEPKVLSGGDFAMIEAVARKTFLDREGEHHALLREAEVAALSVPRGSLTPTEFDEIRSHVTHTFEFLSTIPWGRKFRRVAQIAGAHHERLDGTGYPHRLKGSEIPVQSKIMTISDIFDALTAADRPYKKAVPLERALDILNMEVKQGHIDNELVRIFVDAKIWHVLENPPK